MKTFKNIPPTSFKVKEYILLSEISSFHSTTFVASNVDRDILFIGLGMSARKLSCRISKRPNSLTQIRHELDCKKKSQRLM